MIEVAKNRCGYSGYTCVGIPPLDDVFVLNGVVADTTYRSTGGVFKTITQEGEEQPTTLDYIDNYLNLPVQVRGLVMSVDHILDMSKTPPTAPEVTCKSSDEELYGLFTTLYSSIVDGKAFPKDAVYRVLLEAPLSFTTKNYYYRENPPEDEENRLEPGILEPMLDTGFSPVDIDVDPWNWNGLTFVLVQLTKWRMLVDQRLNELSSAVAHIYGIRNMLMAMQRESICDEFKISKTGGGNPIQWSGTIQSIPKYSVAGGQVKLNGKSKAVSGKSNLTPPFYVYLNVYANGDNGKGVSEFSVKMETKPSGVYSLGIGGVRVVTGKGAKPKYTVYEIAQERCKASLTVHKSTKKGIVKWSGFDMSEILETAECPDPE